jgi:hypothetical protein
MGVTPNLSRAPRAFSSDVLNISNVGQAMLRAVIDELSRATIRVRVVSSNDGRQMAEFKNWPS